jgi:hypothetical protein
MPVLIVLIVIVIVELHSFCEHCTVTLSPSAHFYTLTVVEVAAVSVFESCVAVGLDHRSVDRKGRVGAGAEP